MLLGGRHASGNGSPSPYLLISVCLLGGAVAGADAGADAGAAGCCCCCCFVCCLIWLGLVLSGLVCSGMV